MTHFRQISGLMVPSYTGIDVTELTSQSKFLCRMPPLRLHALAQFLATRG